LVEMMDRGLISVSTASNLLALAEQLGVKEARGGKREKCVPGQKYCSQFAKRAGERSAWRRPAAADASRLVSGKD
jgi:hypothetical protein